MEYRDKKRRRRIWLLKLITATTVIVLIFSAISRFISSNITPVVKSMGEAEVRALAIGCINNAINTVIYDGIAYEDYVIINRDNEGNITYIGFDFVKLNRLTRDIANLAETNIGTIETQTINIPLGAFSGSTVFAAYGPEIEVNLMPIGSVLCEYFSDFDSMGINQTRHRLYIEIVTTICIVLPLEEVPLEITMPVLIAENIIVGDVPETYVNATTQLDALDLMP